MPYKSREKSKIIPNKPTEDQPQEKSKKTPQLLRGMKDILPEDQHYWDFISRRVDATAKTFGFGRIVTPVLEETSLFVRSVGKETDIIEKEMYTLDDKHGSSISLRPEGTAGVVRAYIEHGMLNRPQPVKMFYYGPFFRHDRPQAGRYRQFHQFGFEIIGDKHPVLDAQMLMMTYVFYQEIGLPISLQVNSVGHPECREDYKKVLVDYYKKRKNSLCEDCKNRLQKNPLRLLDCKESDCQVLMQDAPQTVDYLCEECNEHFVSVLEHLDGLEVPYVLNPRLVRGLDYYSNTAFEIWPEVYNPVEEDKDEDEENKEDKDGENANEETEKNIEPVKPSSQSALGGGGRYDYLVEELGGQPAPAIGFAGGIERLINEIKMRHIDIGQPTPADIFVAQLGDEPRKKILKLFSELRKSGFQIAESFSKNGLKPQMEMANKLGVKFTIILGQKELIDGTLLIRDMESGLQETVDYDTIKDELKKRLANHGVRKNSRSTNRSSDNLS